MTSPRPRRLAALLLTSGLLFAAGCQVDQQAEVAKYRAVLDSRVPDPGPYEPGEPLSLARAMALANRNNEQLGLRGEDYLQALIQKNRVVANFLPTVSLQPSFTLEQRATGDAATGTGPGGTGIGTGGTGGGTGTTNTGASAGGGGFRSSGDVSHRTEVPVVGNINLYRGGADVANLQSADANIERFRYQLQDAQATVLLNVAQVYLTVLRSERAVQVLRNSVALQEARLRDVTQQQKNQLATQLTVSQTQAQVSGTRAGLVQAEGDVRNARHTLALLIGADAVAGPLSERSAADAASGPLGDLLYYERQALDGREDLKAAEAAVRSARAQVDVSIAQYYPSVSLNVAGFLYREFYGDA
ncbi:MAG TPA: TolC family protein, partial [Humisphaera sp.]